MKRTQKYTRSVAVNMVIANMIGTGIFTSLGFQVLEDGIPDPFAIVVIWLLGGIISLCGATVYGEIATTINKSGGEYAFLSELYHPLLGFISGWASMIVGFSAAIAGLALATGEYFLPMLGVDRGIQINLGFIDLPISKFIGTLAILLVVAIQLRGVKIGGLFQNYMTYIKVILIAAFLVMPFIFVNNFEPSGVSFAPSDSSFDTIFGLPFAGALVWVMFSYSGWNASTYIVDSLENPKKNLPYSLIVGTLIVTVIYISLNLVFMYVATFDELTPKDFARVDIGNVVAVKIMGEKIGLIFSGAFSLALISGISAMFIAGPKVAQEIGKDYTIFKTLGQQTDSGAPKYAIFLIAVISLVLVYFNSFKDIIEYVGITLSMFSLLTVVGVFILRKRKLATENTVKSWGYPITPIIFILFTIWMIVYFIWSDPYKLLAAFVTMIPAVIIYYTTKNVKK